MRYAGLFWFQLPSAIVTNWDVVLIQQLGQALVANQCGSTLMVPELLSSTTSETLPKVVCHHLNMRLTPLAYVCSIAPLCFASSLPHSSQKPLTPSKNKLLLGRDLVDFHKSLVEIESISGNEKAVADWLYDSLISQGYRAEKQYISEEPERFNVYAWPGNNRDPRVILSSHIDTVCFQFPTTKIPHTNIC